MEKLELTKKDALEFYSLADERGKGWIIGKFGKELFKEDWIKLWEDFQKENKLQILLPFPTPRNREEERTNAHHMLIHIVPVERGSFDPDYDDTDEWKYEPRFFMGSSGFGLSDSSYDYWRASATCGSRLCSGSSEKCAEIAKKYLPIYAKLLTK